MKLKKVPISSSGASPYRLFSEYPPPPPPPAPKVNWLVDRIRRNQERSKTYLLLAVCSFSDSRSEKLLRHFVSREIRNINDRMLYDVLWCVEDKAQLQIHLASISYWPWVKRGIPWRKRLRLKAETWTWWARGALHYSGWNNEVSASWEK